MILGSTNPGKIREIAAICRPHGLPLTSFQLEVPETGSTFHENMMLKANAYSAACPGEFVLVEDSGLVVPAIGNLPGPWSANFFEHQCGLARIFDPVIDRVLIDQINTKFLLSLLQDIPEINRGAYFEIHMAVVKDGEVVFLTEGKSHGYISKEMRGTNGFGYDTIFVGHDTYTMTYAELDSVRKNLLSHRKGALKNLATWLSGVVRDGRIVP